jgi:hypothetical protein
MYPRITQQQLYETTLQVKQMTQTIQLHEKKQKSFEETFLEAVDQSFSSLGDSSKQALYRLIEDKYKIKKTEISSKIAKFAGSLEQIFGAAAKLIELKIIVTIHEKIHEFTYFPEKDDLVFTEYIESLRVFMQTRP